MPTRDSSLEVRAATAGALAYAAAGVSLPAGGLDIWGTPLKGMALYVRIPATVTGTPLLTITVYAGSDTTISSASEKIAIRSGLTAGAEKVIPFSTHKRYVLFEFLITGDTAGSFSAVTADVVLNVGQDYTRDLDPV